MTEASPHSTLAGRGTAAFEVRDSSFIGRARPVEDVEAATAFVETIRTEHPDATHTVPAYRIRAGGTLLREWSSDAGEPTGSAGKPALNVLVQRDLENVAAVVIRYFGGTELGVGGLARAYAQAVSAAVDDAGVIERWPHRRVALEVAYDDSGTVRGLLESAGVRFEATYEETVRFDVSIPVDDADGVLDRIRSATGGRAAIGGRS